MQNYVNVVVLNVIYTVHFNRIDIQIFDIKAGLKQYAVFVRVLTLRY